MELEITIKMDKNELDIPKLPKGYVLVIRAIFGSGKVVNNDGSFYEIDQDPPEKGGKIYYHIYKSYDEAKNDILLALENDSSFEYIIHDNEGSDLECFRPDIKHIPIPEKEGNFLIRLWKRIRNR